MNDEMATNMGLYGTLKMPQRQYRATAIPTTVLQPPKKSIGNTIFVQLNQKGGVCEQICHALAHGFAGIVIEGFE